MSRNLCGDISRRLRHNCEMYKATGLALALILCAIMAANTLCAQTLQPEPAGDVVIGSGSFSPIVRDLDKSLEFYRTLLGVPAPANAAPTTFGADAALLNFLGAPTAQ